MSLLNAQELAAVKQSEKFQKVYREYKIPSNYPDFADILASYLVLLELSQEEILSNPNSYTIGIAHEIANLFGITDKLPIYCLDQELLEQMITTKDKVQQVMTPPAAQKVPFGLLLLPKALLNGLDSTVDFIVFAQYRPGRKLPMDIYGDNSIVRNPPVYFNQAYRIVFSCLSNNGSFYGAVRYVDAKGMIIDGELKEQAQNNLEKQFINKLWAIVAQSLINFEKDWGFLNSCPIRKKFLFFS